MTGSLGHMTPQIPSTDPEAQAKPVKVEIVPEKKVDPKSEDIGQKSVGAIGKPPAGAGKQ